MKQRLGPPFEVAFAFLRTFAGTAKPTRPDKPWGPLHVAGIAPAGAATTTSSITQDAVAATGPAPLDGVVILKPSSSPRKRGSSVFAWSEMDPRFRGDDDGFCSCDRGRTPFEGSAIAKAPGFAGGYYSYPRVPLDSCQSSRKRTSAADPSVIHIHGCPLVPTVVVVCNELGVRSQESNKTATTQPDAGIQPVPRDMSPAHRVPDASPQLIQGIHSAASPCRLARIVDGPGLRGAWQDMRRTNEAGPPLTHR